MLFESISLPVANRLTEDFLAGNPQVGRLFTYQPFQLSSYRERLSWLEQREYPHRDRLAAGLMEYNRRIGNHSAAMAAIEKLQQPHTYVIIGGQQPGVLTGPLYTVHKAISLMHTARRLTAKLGTEVVPVFWIAGEDHDLDEMNHVYLPVAGDRLEKRKLPLSVRGRVSASMLPVERQSMIRFAESFFAEHAETPYTDDLRQLVRHAAEQSDTLSDWFARLMAHLFGKHGLILVESSLPFVRELEQPVFRDVLLNNERIAAVLRAAETQIRGLGYPPQLELDETQAHLFLYENGERQALHRSGDQFSLKDGRLLFSREELLARLEEYPDQFSANVVTRPLMQERLFPTLAFIGGSSEVAYWAFYREYFSQFGCEMPVVQPRTSITFLDGAVSRILEGFGLSPEEALRDLKGWKQRWIDGLPPIGVGERFEQARRSISQLYQPLVDEVSQIDPGLSKLADKNLNILLDQVRFLQRRTESSILAKHETSVKRIERIEAELQPFGTLQERTYNVFSYLNKYGLDLLDRLVDADLPFDATHKLIYLQG
ncbi:bacillithiol biosynthesis cysteine-adding enzyme BshC [Brevibacillus humidisoli]|uniref:bacillithiol biosynthesis cysteine-adding enzyme BshC n=1 Tax=Brevibacillus humidisoli TaxID=2895522 RepID=UPI001E53096B|nr:bacillithiol biosynthesis cysteine-adding enzyme BshC [Brevibacillus humidisoli]UFJ41912.1 bacillithiol biosynthesis cysteine-adding enzyme BshC [Brevibacillus humidisoli]